MNDNVNTIAVASTGLGAMEGFDIVNHHLTTAAVNAAGVTAEHAVEVVDTVLSTPDNPIAIIDIGTKIIIAVVTLWRLIKKPKPRNV